MQSRLLKMALWVALAWLPALFWVTFAGTGVVLGVGGLFSSEPLGGLLFIALGVGGILGFIGITIASWTTKPVSPTLRGFLLCGVVALLVSAGYLVFEGDWDLSDPFTLLQLSYFVACPMAFGLYRIVADGRTGTVAD